MIVLDSGYQWIPFYEDLADKLLAYKDKRSELFDLMKKLSSEQPLMQYLHFEREDWWGPRQNQIDPFTVIGVMNRGANDKNRAILGKVLADAFDVKTLVPTEFAGIPVLSSLSSIISGNEELWDLFVLTMQATENHEFPPEFSKAFEKAIAVSGNGLGKITMALYWVRPYLFMPLDSKSRPYLNDKYGITIPNKNLSGSDYINFLIDLKKAIDIKSPGVSFPEVSFSAWIERDTKPPKITNDPPEVIQGVSQQGPFSEDKISARNIILYGAPGTGKTYSSIQYAVAIIEGKPIAEVKAEGYEEIFKRYLKYKDDGLIAFTTFHQSFSYEEFIEGIRPVVLSEEKSESAGDIEYEVHDGIFKAFCDKAGTPVRNGTNVDLGLGKNPTVWKVSLEGTGENPTRMECLDKGHIRVGWDEHVEKVYETADFSQQRGYNPLNAFYNKMQIGDIVMSCYSSKTIDAIGVITGEPEWHDEYAHYKRVRKVNWLVKGINEDIVDLNAGKSMTLSTVYKLSISVSDALQILKKHSPDLFGQGVKIPNRVFIIDEINRGNISKIFGELITLIEPSKRVNASEELRATLPYSGQNFGVPENVYIIGTMNTADRSTAIIDTALRRRFSFVEMQPESELLHDVLVDGINVEKMLETLNKRISVLLDRHHTIGHSYLLPLKKDRTINNLAGIFENNIIPLLQEYFYDDYEKIQFVLGDNQKPDDSTRFIIKKNDIYELFGNTDFNFSEYYEVNREALKRNEAYAFMQ
jgi:5-methylcytosine-specific restriction protein B